MVSIFTNFLAYVKTHFNCIVKIWQTDGGWEFQTLTSLLTKKEVVHRLTFPHTHKQIGSVERKHTHVVETSLTLLSHASFPLNLWDHAFLAATYLINIMPTPVLGMDSPYKLLHHTEICYKF